jgi:predicted amidophosphoribosyltransferase
VEIWSALLDLVLPADCPGCGATAGVRTLCAACATALAGVTPQRVRPEPAPDGLPRCVALAAYAGALRGALIAYKEHNRHGLAAPLGDRLADVVVTASGPAPVPVLLLPVPATAAAARRRYGDHMRRLADRAAVRLRRRGWPAAVAHPVRARPRADSAELGSAERLRTAAGAFAVVPRQVAAVREAAVRGTRLVIVDDIVTTGATLAAVAGHLRAAGVVVPSAAVLAATRRRVSTR